MGEKNLMGCLMGEKNLMVNQQGQIGRGRGATGGGAHGSWHDLRDMRGVESAIGAHRCSGRLPGVWGGGGGGGS
jgi:hypothetical protein